MFWLFVAFLYGEEVMLFSLQNAHMQIWCRMWKGAEVEQFQGHAILGNPWDVLHATRENVQHDNGKAIAEV